MAIINCPTCSQDDFEEAYYELSSPGDTIVLPAGSATWGNSSRPNAGIIYLITEITVMGQGDDTVITMDNSGATYANGVIAMWSAITWKDMKFIGASSNPVSVFSLASYFNPTTGLTMTGGFTIDNVTYEGPADGYFCYIGPFVDTGLIKNCRLSSDLSYAELIFMRGRTDTWQNPNTWGTGDNVFIEDCVINGGYVCDANANARMVVRFNTIDGESKVDGHGLASNSPATSVRCMEVYNNVWTKEGAGNWSNIEMRGGACMVFNNVCETGWFFLHDYAYDNGSHGWPNFGYGGTSTLGSPTTITTSQPHGYETGWPVWVQAPLGVIFGMYSITVTGPTTFTIPVVTIANETIDYATTYKTPYDYPITQQIGEGEEGGPREPGYVFGNLQNGVSWPRVLGTVSANALTFYQAQLDDGGATFTDRDVIQSNRDFFADDGFDDEVGCSVGTTAEMEALTPSVEGYGFWVTDQGSWNTTLPAGESGLLYRWDGADWELFYTPYQYPHPGFNPPVEPSSPGNPSTSAMAGMM
jgi:hypothetical protein